jgi:adenosylcobinamide-GDP ribazoletransferase
VGALSLLTRVPTRRGLIDMAGAVPWFPVVGALVGLAVAGAYAAAELILPRMVAAGLAVGLGVLLTGALHEDGLGDTADALGSGATGEEALRILADPRLGTYGVVAVILSILVHVAALASLGPLASLVIVPAAHALGRGAAAGVLGLVRPAADRGLGATYAGAVTTVGSTAAVAIAIAIGVVGLGWWALPAIGVAAIGAWAISGMSVRRIGGITGDVLGAVEQVAEVGALVVGCAAVTAGALLPWWG